MAMPLQKLLDMVQDQEVTVWAGANGLDNLVRWVHMVEGTEISSFLEGGEMVFITGIALGDRLTLFDLVRDIQSRGASGVLVNIGPYIKELPQEVVDFCESKDFPLFTVPWHIHMAIIMKRFSEAILLSDQSWQELGGAIRNALFAPDRIDGYLPVFERHGLAAEQHYCAALLEQPAAEQPSSRILLEVENQLTRMAPQAVFTTVNGRILLLCPNFTEQQTADLTNKILSACSQAVPGTVFYAGVGRMTKSVRCINKSYHLAEKVLQLQKKCGRPGKASCYSQQGVYRILMGVEDGELLREYVAGVLTPLLDFDRTNGTDYVAFLKTWFACGCSAQRTAEELFLHRNTVDYRLHRVEELLNLDLTNFDDRVQLDLALKLLEL